MSGKTSRNPSRNRDWRGALAQLRPDLPAAHAPEPFDFANERDWTRAVDFAQKVVRAVPGAQFPPGTSQYPRSALAFVLQWATANAVPGLAPICDGLIRLGGQAAKKAGTERAIRLGAMYLLKYGDRKAVEEFVCQDYGSIHAATAFLINLDDESVSGLTDALLQKLARDISPAIAAKLVERLARADTTRCASVLNTIDAGRRISILRSVPKQTQRELRASGADLAGVLMDRTEIATRGSQLTPEEVRALRTNRTDLELLYWLRKHGEVAQRKIAADKIREYRDRSQQPARPSAPYSVNPRLPLHRLASSWRHEDRKFALEQAPLAATSIPLFSTLILDNDIAIATRALERLAQVSADLARQRAAELPKLVSPRSLRWLAKGATTDELGAILDALSRADKILSADAVLILLGAGFDPERLASHLAREENGGGLGVLAAFHVHRGDTAALTRVANLASSSIAAEDRHDVIRTALSHSFRAWRYANNVGAGLSSLIAALADTDYRTAYGLALNVLRELNTALRFPRVRRLGDALEDAAALCAARLQAVPVAINVDGYLIERGDEFVAQVEGWLIDNLSTQHGDGAIQITSKDDGHCTISLGDSDSSIVVHAYLAWPAPPQRLADLTAALGRPQLDRLRDYVPLMRQVNDVTRELTEVEFGWALVLTSTHDADYFEKELSKLAFWVHSLKNSLGAFSTHSRPNEATRSTVERYRSEAQRLLGVFGFHDDPVDEEFDVRLLAEGVLANYRPAAQARRIRLATSVSAETYVRGAARHLERILSNFVANAVDAVPAGGSVVIGAGIDTSRYELTLSVFDDGPGLAAENESPRELSDSARTEQRDAVHFGMGLFEARQLALELNGTVALETRAEGGTVARVTVPIELPDAP